MTEIYEKLICFDCKKYLSAFPIKVYPNRQVKCGRCSSNDDDGTVSKLYETIAKELKFPCINRYEECKMLLRPGEVIAHENVCLGTSIKCPVCCNFEGQSLAMIEHFKQKHPDCFLNLPEFSISFNDHQNKEKIYLYASDLEYSCRIISVQYDDIVNMLYLDVKPLRKNVEDNMRLTQKFELYSINNKLMYKSSEEICTRYAGYSRSNLNNRFNICINEQYPNDVAICKFFIMKVKKLCFKRGLPVQKDTYALPQSKEEPKTTQTIIKKPCYLNHLTDIMSLDIKNNGTQRIIHNFYNIRSLREPMNSPIFYIANTSWKMMIHRGLEGNTPYLAFFLQKHEINVEKRFSYKVNAEVKLLSHDPKNNVVMSFQNNIFGKRRNESMNWGWNTFLLWNILLDTNKKYLQQDDDIEVELQITLVEILPHKYSCRCLGCI